MSARTLLQCDKIAGKEGVRANAFARVAAQMIDYRRPARIHSGHEIISRCDSTRDFDGSPRREKTARRAEAAAINRKTVFLSAESIPLSAGEPLLSYEARYAGQCRAAAFEGQAFSLANGAIGLLYRLAIIPREGRRVGAAASLGLEPAASKTRYTVSILGSPDAHRC
jgi:hypothetical protein